MQAYVCERLGENVHYLSLMRINKGVIKGYNIQDNHDKLVSLKPDERERERKHGNTEERVEI
jgi:hypothetical protein